MKNILLTLFAISLAFLISVIAALILVPSMAEANSGDFSGGVAIGTGYAGVDTAPTNGLITQGNVGIGTTTPLSTLDVLAPVSTKSVNFYDDGISSWITEVVSGQFRNVLEENTPSVAFNWGTRSYGASGGSSITEWMRISSSGNLGIGTTNPNRGIHIYGSDAALAIQDSTTGGHEYVYTNDNAGDGSMGLYDETDAAFRWLVNSSGNVGIGTTTPRGGATLDVNGKLYIATFASSSSTTVCQTSNVLSSCTSARRFKEHVEPSNLGLNEVLQMRPVTFDLKDHNDNWEKHDFGFIAEDMERINPLFVTYDEDEELLGVRYMQLTAVNVSAIQELNGIIEKQQQEIDELRQTIEGLKHEK
jgi:hypothetical protein